MGGHLFHICICMGFRDSGWFRVIAPGTLIIVPILPPFNTGNTVSHSQPGGPVEKDQQRQEHAC